MVRLVFSMFFLLLVLRIDVATGQSRYPLDIQCDEEREQFLAACESSDWSSEECRNFAQEMHDICMDSVWRRLAEDWGHSIDLYER